MKITLSKKNKSLHPFESEILEDFTIIIGKNGSGKTQLLNLISEKYSGYDNGIDISSLSPIKKVQYDGLAKNSSYHISTYEWKNNIETLHSQFHSLGKSTQALIAFLIENDLTQLINEGKSQFPDSSTDDYINKIKNAHCEIFSSSQFLTQLLDFSAIETPVLKYLSNKHTLNAIYLLNNVYNYTKIKVFDIKLSDCYTTPINEKIFNGYDIFATSIELIFYGYARRRDNNRKEFFCKKEEGEANNSISDNDFILNNTPPWEIINSIFSDNCIGYYFKGISRREIDLDNSIDLKLHKKETDEVINFNDLSSGESIVIGLILRVFICNYNSYELQLFPDLLVLDEPDAHLHPEMTQLLLDVLKKTFAEKYNVKVILTTHSPSTIALAPENSIYQLTNGINTSLKKITKDDALSLLTSFIPTLSINYKNHRQVFVESPTDVTFYQSLYNKHSQSQKCDFKLYFISNSPGKSNCQHVYSIVRSIRESGNTTAFGIVDWDKNNQPENFIHVHGLSERYSIENFVLDPIYIICLLIELNNAHNILEDIGFDKTYNQYNLGQESSEKIQTCFKVFFNKIEAKFPAFKYESERSSIEYLNGQKIEIPDFYLKTKGHDIVEKIKTVFPAIAGRYKNEGDLQNKLTEIMCKCYPFVPLTSIKTIEAIANQ